MLGTDLHAGVAGDAEVGLADRDLTLKGTQGFGGTMFSACAAFSLVTVYDTTLGVKRSQGNLSAFFFSKCDGENGPFRANRAAGSAVKVAEALGEVEMGFEETRKAVFKGGRLEYMGGAGGNA